MFNLFKYTLIFVLLILGGSVAYLGIRQLKLSSITNLSFIQKIKKSILLGLFSGLFVLFCFAVVPIFLWDGSNLPVDMKAISSLIACIVVPVFFFGTIGTFIQIAYLDSLLRCGKKD